MKHIFKIPFILFVIVLFVIVFIQTWYKELGVVQEVSSYTMDMPHLLIYSIFMIFLAYGVYSSLRDLIMLIINISSNEK